MEFTVKANEVTETVIMEAGYVEAFVLEEMLDEIVGIEGGIIKSKTNLITSLFNKAILDVSQKSGGNSDNTEDLKKVLAAKDLVEEMLSFFLKYRDKANGYHDSISKATDNL